MSTQTGQPLLKVENLRKWFPIKQGLFSRTVGHVKAVDDVSFDVKHNETLGLVGESGCGKTTVGRTILRLIEPSSGKATFRGQPLFDLKGLDLRKMRRYMQIIFQDPYSSLNPRMTVDSLIGDAMELHGIAKGDERRNRIKDLLVRVGLQPEYINRYPHEFSGGQRQRIGIARSLALKPEFIVCDEAVSALDVSVQAQIINLLEDLQEEFKLSYLFIAHDLSVVRHISDRVAVMYLGQIVELGGVKRLYSRPLHPYTRALLSAIPTPVPKKKNERKRIILTGDVPSPTNPPSGCRFHTRCPAKFGPCSHIVPRSIDVADGHWVRCHLYDPDHYDDIPLDTRSRYLDESPVVGPEPEIVESSDAPNVSEERSDEMMANEPAETEEPAEGDEPAETEDEPAETEDEPAAAEDEPAETEDELEAEEDPAAAEEEPVETEDEPEAEDEAIDHGDEPTEDEPSEDEIDEDEPNDDDDEPVTDKNPSA